MGLVSAANRELVVHYSYATFGELLSLTGPTAIANLDGFVEGETGFTPIGWLAFFVVLQRLAGLGLLGSPGSPIVRAFLGIQGADLYQDYTRCNATVCP